MVNLYISETIKTPEVDFKTNGDLFIKGNSYPEDVIIFYKPLLLWLDQFLSEKPNRVNLNISLKYINTTSIKSVLSLILKIRSFENSHVSVKWLYEIDDEDMLATGQDLESLSNLKFEFVRK